VYSREREGTKIISRCFFSQIHGWPWRQSEGSYYYIPVFQLPFHCVRRGHSGDVGYITYVSVVLSEIKLLRCHFPRDPASASISFLSPEIPRIRTERGTTVAPPGRNWGSCKMICVGQSDQRQDHRVCLSVCLSHAALPRLLSLPLFPPSFIFPYTIALFFLSRSAGQGKPIYSTRRHVLSGELIHAWSMTPWSDSLTITPRCYFRFTVNCSCSFLAVWECLSRFTPLKYAIYM